MPLTLLKFFKHTASVLSEPYTSHYLAPDLILVAPGLGLQLGLSQATSSPAQVAAICRSLCSSCQVAWGRAQAAADLGLHLKVGPRASTVSGQLQTTLDYKSTSP